MSSMEGWLSFGTPSFVSKSESICETEEFDKIDALHNAGVNALSEGDGVLALHFYNEALEIDGANVESLCGHCLALLLTRAFDEARQDAVSVIQLEAKNPRGYYMEALCLEHEEKYEESLKVLLRAFDLRNADDEIQIISGRILSVAQKSRGNESCDQPEDLTDIEDDDFKKLSEAGKILLAAGKPDLAADVLVAAMKLDGKRTETAIAKHQLLIGQALAASGNMDAAVSSFQDCLKICESCEKDSAIIRVEALSRLAEVYTNVSDSLHAIICYEKLLDFANGSDDQSTGNISGSAFVCGIHLNLSVTYRSVGDLERARHHARLASSVSEKDSQYVPLQSAVQLNLGILADATGDNQDAATRFEDYRKLCKRSGDERGLMTAYGCLGNVYAHLNCCNLAAAYHDRQLMLAHNSRKRKAMVRAKQMEGDSLVLLRRYSAAILLYQELLRSCEDEPTPLRVSGYFKLGRAFLLDNKGRYARLCFEKALLLSGGSDSSLIAQTELSLASILMDSDDPEDLERARNIYLRQIQHLEHELFLKSEHAVATHVVCLKLQLKECHHGLVCILSKQDDERNALVHVERLYFRMSDCRHSSEVPDFNMEEEAINKLMSITEHFKCCIIYYYLLPKVLLIWFLSAGGKIFHVRKDLDENFPDAVSEAGFLIKCLFSYLSSKELLYSCENRALPLKQTNRPGHGSVAGKSIVTQHLHVGDCNGCNVGIEGLVSEKSEHLSTVKVSDISDCAKDDMDCGSKNDSADLEADSAERRLYDLLVFPVETFLRNECVEDDHIIIVPGEVLNRCPFWSLCSGDGVPLGEQYHITVTGSLTILNTMVENSNKDSLTGLNHQCAVDVPEDLSAAGCGNVSNHSVNAMPTRICDDAERINPKCTSNPRLTVLSGCHSTSPILKKKKGQSDVVALNSSPDLIRPQGSASAVQDNLENMPSLPSSQKKQRFVVIGCPSLPKHVMLDGCQSTLIIEENRMMTECVTVADLLGAECVVGLEATKDRFLEKLSSASILHITTLFSSERGNLAMSPNPVPDLGQHDLADEALYLVQADEIMARMTSAKLVVVSGGWSVVGRRGTSPSQAIVSAFLSAGACCVLVVMYPVPSEVLVCFYEGFYKALPRVNGRLSIAFRLAIDHVNLDERFRETRFSSAFALIGVDATIDMISISRSMIFHSIERVKDLAKIEVDLPTSSDAIHMERDKHKIQQFLSSLILTMSSKSELLHHLIELLEVGSASSCASEPFRTSTILQDDLCKNVVAIKLLKFLGFTFQPPEGASISHPYVLVPCSDDRGLLCVCLEAVRSLNELSSDRKCLMAVQQLLPVTPSLAGDLSNLLSYFESDPTGEVKTSNEGGNSFSLWKDKKIRTMLMCLGFRYLDQVIHFRNTTKNRSLLCEMYRLLRLFVPSNKQTTFPPVPCLRDAWATEVESSARMGEKIQLSSRVKEENDRMRIDLDRAVTWHRSACAGQGKDVLQRKHSSRSFITGPEKVRVHSGSTPSQTRIPVDDEVIMDLREMDQRRDYAHYVHKRSLDKVMARRRGTVSNLVLPHLFR